MAFVGAHLVGIRDYPRLEAAEWVRTAYGRLFHLEGPRRELPGLGGREGMSTLCGRLAFDSTDAPWCWHGGMACSVCVTKFLTP